MTIHVTADRPASRLAAARLGGARRLRPGAWLAPALALALASPAAAARAEEPPAGGAPAKDWSKVPLSETPAAPPPVTGQFRIHGGWYFETGLALGGAAAGGPGGTSSLADLAGGHPSTPWGIDLRGGYTLRPDLRLGLVVSLVMAQGSQGGLETSATVGRVGGELSWHPRGDGPFLRGELGLGFLELIGVDGSAFGPSNTDVSFTGPALTLGGGWLFGWHQAGIAHLFVGADLSWAHYGSSGSPGDQLDWSLAWSLRVGVDVW